MFQVSVCPVRTESDIAEQSRNKLNS